MHDQAHTEPEWPDPEHTVFLVDGTSQLFRAYFAIRGLSNSEGLPTNAVYGFTTMLRKLIKERQPRYLAVAFDLAGPTFRHDAFEDYKANRPEPPEDLSVQVPYAKDVCRAMRIPVLEREGFEADDLIATFARKARDAGYQVVIVASDKDLLQLVGDGIYNFNPVKEVLLDARGVEETFGVPPDRVPDVLGLMGDSIDNIPGVPGVGEKTALHLVRTYGGVEAILERARRFVEAFEARDRLLEAVDAATAPRAPSGATDAVRQAAQRFLEALRPLLEVERDPAFAARLQAAEKAVRDAQAALESSARGVEARKVLRALKRELKALDKGSARRIWTSIHEHEAQARLSRRLAVLDASMDVPFEPEALRTGEPDVEQLRALFRSLEFRTLLAELDAAGQGEPPPLADADSEQADYRPVLDDAGLAKAVASLEATARIAVDTETDGTDALRARLVGLSFTGREGEGWYVPLAHDYLGAPVQLDVEAVREALGPVLADPDRPKVAQNLKYDLHVLRRHGLPVEGWELDTMVAAFLLNPGRTTYGLDSLAEEYLGYQMVPYHELAGRGRNQKTLNQVDVEAVARYAAEDADITLRLANVLRKRLEDAGLWELYRTVDGPLLPLLAKMESFGIRVDPEVLGRMAREMDEALERLRGEIHALAGVEFNVDSPKQLREVLFDRLGLKTRRRTAKAGLSSTDAQTLRELASDHPIAEKLLDYRELSKLKGTYVDALPKLIHPETGRVHTWFNPVGAATGRLSSSDPNLQNIPARTEMGRKIRSAFVPDSGYVFLSSDYSQVELRVLAHLADDPELLEAFRRGEDIHRYTAARIFGVDKDEVTDVMRRRAKAVNFGVLYGMSETRLAAEQKISRAEARRFIESYFQRFQGVRAYIDRVREEARREGAVRTLLGRVRYFPQLQQRAGRSVQEQALRAAVNTTVQGTAADLMKLAMLRVDEALPARALGARMLLQVHDELLFEVPEGEVESTRKTVRETMEQVYPLKVPLVVDQKVGRNWMEVT